MMEGNKTDISQLSGENSQGPSTAMQTEIVTPKIKPVLQLVAKRRNNHVKFVKLVFSDVLAKVLCAAVIQRSLNFVLPVHFPWRINNDGMEEKFLGNITIAEDSMTGFRKLIIEIVLDPQQPFMAM